MSAERTGLRTEYSASRQNTLSVNSSAVPPSPGRISVTSDRARSIAVLCGGKSETSATSAMLHRDDARVARTCRRQRERPGQFWQVGLPPVLGVVLGPAAVVVAPAGHPEQ